MQNVEVGTRLQTVFFPQLLEGFVGRTARFVVDDQRTRRVGRIVCQGIDRAFRKAAKTLADLIVIKAQREERNLGQDARPAKKLCAHIRVRPKPQRLVKASALRGGHLPVRAQRLRARGRQRRRTRLD